METSGSMEGTSGMAGATAPPAGTRSRTLVGDARKALAILEAVKVRPCYGPQPGKTFGTMCDVSREACFDLALALNDLEDLAGEEATAWKFAQIEAQVGELKESVGRIERALTGLREIVSKDYRRGPPASGQGTVGKKRTAAAVMATKTAPERKAQGPTASTSTAPTEEGTPWTAVIGRRIKKGQKTQVKELTDRGKGTAVSKPPPQPKGKRAPGPRRKARRLPKAAAVLLTPIGGKTNADIMRRARECVDLADMGIDLSRDLRTKGARNGGNLIEVSGPESTTKADRLARDLEDVLYGWATVSRPVKRAELRISGLDDSVSVDEVRREICKKGECSPDAVTLGELRRASGGASAIWVRCPLASALVLSRASGLQIGWSTARVHLLEERPLQCYQCLEFGHFAAACKSTVNRRGRCFRCGGADHTLRECTSAMTCCVCAEGGRNASHRLGGRACPAAFGGMTRKRRGPPGALPGKGRRGRRGDGPRPPGPPAMYADVGTADLAAGTSTSARMIRDGSRPARPSVTGHKSGGRPSFSAETPRDEPMEIVQETKPPRREGGRGSSGVDDVRPRGPRPPSPEHLGAEDTRASNVEEPGLAEASQFLAEEGMDDWAA